MAPQCHSLLVPGHESLRTGAGKMAGVGVKGTLRLGSVGRGSGAMPLCVCGRGLLLCMDLTNSAQKRAESLGHSPGQICVCASVTVRVSVIWGTHRPQPERHELQCPPCPNTLT